MDDTKKMIERYKRELMELSRTAPKTAAPAEASAEKAPEARAPRVIGYVNEESGEFPAVYDRFIAELTGVADAEEHGVQAETELEVSGGEDVRQPASPPMDGNIIGESYDEQTGISESVDINEDILDASEPIFTPPKYSEIPSSQQVREEITEQSDPRDNYPEENVSGVTDNSPTAPRADLADVQSVSEERAERLDDQPISGGNKDEQLTGRSFEDERTPENPPDSVIRQGSGAVPAEYPKPVYDSFEDFERKNAGRGTILFRVYTAQEALPIMGAVCVLTKDVGGGTRVISELVTDESGQTRTQSLPAPSKELSQHFENEIQPFALYDATVRKDDYAEVVLRDIPVFDGVQSIQRVAMVPIDPAENGDITEEITEVQNAER